ncbi:hypothetical protein CALCODRAFT_38589 [Calocera cornea HHB12733]|uniref:Uncharacterized protein n=1 Tax=Calocera cornea HHB12733 TaxID=1353952 RepID=A0A165DX16_9BASI|nr:hypothetical protein CALCODRAFT_38589 [Calocera cornea HHB12733]
MPDVQSQYRAATHVPLIQSPSLRIPQPVVMPQDIHPLPDTLEPYMVYTFTLEQRALPSLSQLRASLSALQSTHEQTLANWELEKQRRKREALRKVAPGFEGGEGVLVPTRAVEMHPHPPPPPAQPHPTLEGTVAQAGTTMPAGPMDDLVAGLERMGYGEVGK